MGINIDSFLDEFIKEKQEEESLNNKGNSSEQNQQDTTPKVDLNFEKDVQKNLNKISSQSTATKDLNQLQQIYEEIKSFDENLPQKFLSVEELGNTSLESIGKTYSQEYLQQLNTLTSNIEKKINSYLEKISQDLLDKNYVEIPKLLKELKTLVKSIPQESQIFSLEMKTKVKEKEIEVFQVIEEFKKNDLKNIKNQLNQEINSLMKNLKPGNSQMIQDQISNIQHIFDSIPPLFKPTLTHEQLIINQAIVKAQTFLKEELKQEAQRKITSLKSIEEEFNTAVFNKDLNRALVYYNQIIQEFTSIPNHPIEKKMELLETISQLHQKLNKLYINNNVTLFLQTYNYSKIIEEIKDYINRANASPQTIKPQNITLLENKLQQLPKRFEQDKQELSKQLQQLYEKAMYKKNNSQKQNGPQTSNSNNTASQEQDVHQNILREIDSLYKQFQKAQTKQEAQTPYKKIDFYLNLANISEEKSQQIKTKLAKEWKNKQ